MTTDEQQRPTEDQTIARQTQTREQGREKQLSKGGPRRKQWAIDRLDRTALSRQNNGQTTNADKEASREKQLQQRMPEDQTAGAKTTKKTKIPAQQAPLRISNTKMVMIPMCQMAPGSQ